LKSQPKISFGGTKGQEKSKLKINDPRKRWANEQSVFKGRSTDDKQIMNKCSTLLSIREIQVMCEYFKTHAKLYGIQQIINRY
jgi:hypothetical protein